MIRGVDGAVWSWEYTAWIQPEYGECPKCGAPQRRTRRGYRWVPECVRVFAH